MNISISATIGGCPFNLFSDRTAVLELTPTLVVGPTNTFVKSGHWDVTVVCPAASTNLLRYPLQSAVFLFVFVIILIRLFQLPILPLIPATKFHLSGSVEIV